MKKELCALALLLALVAGAVLNVRRVEQLTEMLTELADRAEHAAINGDYDTARMIMTDAVKLWEKNDRYTHIFISHAETDTAADCFFEAAGVINDKAENEELHAAFEKLRYHLDSLTDMERVTLASIF